LVRKPLRVITNFLMAVMVVVVFIGVVFRYFLHHPLSWPEELSKLAFTWVVFLGAALAAGKNEHIAIETVMDLFPAKVKSIMRFAINLLTIVFLVIVTVVSTQFLLSELGDTSAAMQISMVWWALPIPISSLIIIGYTVRDLVKRVLPALRAREKAKSFQPVDIEKEGII
jgi:TRAP-type C4-dicarboxylate transport system permease small subunit